MTDNLIRELNLERSQLLDLLMKAREIMARTAGVGQSIKRTIERDHPVFWTSVDQQLIDDAQAFLDAGLFGDQATETNQETTS